MLETTSAPGNPGATVSLKNDGPEFNIPPEAKAPDATPADKAETAQPAQKDDPAQDPAAKTPDDKAAKTDEKEKPRSPVQQRIDELTRDKRAAERLAQQRLADLERLQTRLREKEAKLDPNDFAAQEDFRVEKAVTQGRLDDTAAEARRALDDAAQARSETFMSKVELALASDPSVEAKLEQFANVPVTPFAASFIAESEKAVELAAHVGTTALTRPWHAAARLAYRVRRALLVAHHPTLLLLCPDRFARLWPRRFAHRWVIHAQNSL